MFATHLLDLVNVKKVFITHLWKYDVLLFISWKYAILNCYKIHNLFLEEIINGTVHIWFFCYQCYRLVHVHCLCLSPFHFFKLSEFIIVDVVRDNIKEEKGLIVKEEKGLIIKDPFLHYCIIYIDIFLPNCKNSAHELISIYVSCQHFP